MNDKRSYIELRVTINAKIDKVWSILLKPSVWWEGAHFEAKKGGRFSESWIENGVKYNSKGFVLDIKEPEKLTISWKDDNWPDNMQFTFTLHSEKDFKTELLLIEEGWEIFTLEKKMDLMNDHKAGWLYHMENLKNHIEKSSI